MLFRKLIKAVRYVRTVVETYFPFTGPPLDCGLSLLSKQAAQAANSKTRRAVQDGLGARMYCKLADAGHFLGEAGMNSEVTMMDVSQTEQILQNAGDSKISAIMSYLSRGKWHVAKVVFSAFDTDTISVQTTQSHHKSQPININIEQPVGVSFKQDYGKFVFDATVTDLRPATEPGAGGTIVLTVPRGIEVIQRRSYFRVEVPESFRVKVTMWRRKGREDSSKPALETFGRGADYCTGTLVDISAGGAQVALDESSEDGSATDLQLRNGQFIGMRFTPLPYETPLVLNAQIRNMLPRADGNKIYLGLQIVGLEASPEGRQTLARLVGVVERYYKMNQDAQAKKKKHAHEVATA